MALEAIVNELYLPYTPAQVWGALAGSAALARWLMPNDFEARVGHHFTFQTEPVPPYFDGTVRCEVTAVEPPTYLAFTWVGGPIDTVVSFTLRPDGGGTHLRLEHAGFDTSTPTGRFAMAGLSRGWTSPEMAARLAATVAAQGRAGG
jgi:uncharacterized protein YndB with AHSA1/START domain